MAVKAEAHVINDQTPHMPVKLTMRGDGKVFIAIGSNGVEVSCAEMEDALRRVGSYSEQEPGSIPF